MKIKNYTDWQAAVQAECGRLRSVERYLNEEGEERLAVFSLLINLACFCDTAEELLAWIKCREGLNQHEILCLSSSHAAAPIRMLHIIDESEESNHDAVSRLQNVGRSQSL